MANPAVKTGYTQPKLFNYDGDMSKDWYVGFRFTNPVTRIRKPFQIRMGINYQQIRSDRMADGKAVKKIIDNALQCGWNPFDEDIKAYIIRTSEQQQSKEINDKTFFEAVNFALQEGVWATKTRHDYTGCAKFFKTAAEKLNLHSKPIRDISRQHIMQMLSHIKKERGWSGNAYNKNARYLCAILGILQRWEIIEVNPASNILRLPVAKTMKYVPFSEDEKRKIKDELISKHLNFYKYVMVVYHTGIRPKEVLALQVKDIDMISGEIKIIPDLIAENSKTKIERTVPINPHLMKSIQDMRLGEYPGNYYIFGSPNGGVGGKGYGVSQSDYFSPNAYKIKRDAATKLWKEIIWEGLGIHKHLYAMKHTGADDKILAGLDIATLKSLYGHSSEMMTEKYVTRLMEVHKKKIIELSPDF